DALQRRARVLGCVSRIVASSLEVARESFGGLSITAAGRARDTRSIREIGPGVPDPSVAAAVESSFASWPHPNVLRAYASQMWTGTSNARPRSDGDRPPSARFI